MVDCAVQVAERWWVRRGAVEGIYIDVGIGAMVIPLPMAILLGATGYIGCIYLLLSLWVRRQRRCQG